MPDSHTVIIARMAIAQYRLAVLESGASVSIAAESSAPCVVIGGEPVGERLKWWNFVSSHSERIDSHSERLCQRAKQDWQQGHFQQVPEETEFIPLPEKPNLQEQPL